MSQKNKMVIYMTTHILETNPGSNMFATILKNPEGIHGFKLRNIHYPESKTTARIYPTLKILLNERLVNLKTEKIESRAKKPSKDIRQERKLYTVNFNRFIELIDYALPKEKRLLQEEKAELIKLIKSKNFINTLPENYSNLKFLSIIKLYLNSFSKLILMERNVFKETKGNIEKLKNPRMKKLLKQLMPTNQQTNLSIIIELYKLSDSLLEKLSFLDNPVSYFTEMICLISKGFTESSLNIINFLKGRRII